MKAMQAMTRNVVCVREEDSLQTAKDLMREWDIRHLPVTRDGVLVGILTDRDILPYLPWRSSTDPTGRSVGDAMARNPITCRPSDSISHIAGVMSANKIDCVPVVEEQSGEMVGLITSMDLVDLLREREILDVSRSVPWSYSVQNPSSESSPSI